MSIIFNYPKGPHVAAAIWPCICMYTTFYFVSFIHFICSM